MQKSFKPEDHTSQSNVDTIGMKMDVIHTLKFIVEGYGARGL
jgi:hypothetical protein